ncbi:hypothetical protein PFMC_01450, partial [Plasmodium falciparum CAMP/Malaysia]
EWAEDFCRKRKYKLKDAIKNCRGEGGNDKYCDRNGYDCTKTIRGKDILVEGDNCHKCSVACTNFVNWIKNQKKEFEKQKNKYADEIKKADGTKGTTITTANGKTINNWYVKEFYEKLQDKYRSVDKFLQKLNDETTCKDPPQVGTETASKVDFNEKIDKTFDHKEYCDTCPWCEKKIKNEQGKWEDRQDTECGPQNKDKFNKDNTTEIHLLSTDKETSGILEKYKTFCDNTQNDNEIKKWQCHYEKKSVYEEGYDKNYCVQGEGNTFTEGHDFKSYVSFFSGWINEMLDDSIKWREQLKKCINNKKGNKCISGCKRKCDCFKNWVQHMRTEWNQIEKHFDKQGDLEGNMRNITLKWILDLFFMDKIKEAYGEEDSKELMEKINKIDMSLVIRNIENSEDAIKILLVHEEKEAGQCVENNKQETCPSNDTRARGRSENQEPPPVIPRKDFPDEKDKDPVFKDEDEVEEDKDQESEVVEGTVAEVTEVTDTSVNVCSIVETLFSDPTKFSDACGLKYGSKSHVGWNCNSDIFKPENDGACMPPRRQKLYLKKLQTFNGQKPDDLRKAFIECAAIETFFAWYKYKADKKKEKQEENEEALYGIGGEVISTDEELKKDLENGKIPYEFKRQMFYTFGDYKDIFFGKNIGDDVNEVEKNIKNVFPNSDTPNDQDNKNWWKTYGKDIWEGMLCGLSYASGTEKDKDRTQLTTTYNYKTIKNDLEDFATVPQFLRWFDEWGEEFCRKQKIKIDKIKVSCRGKYGGNKCSAEGYDCEITKLTENKIFKNLLCPSCEKECTNYKKWIKNKNYEFNKQNEKYKKEYKNDKNPGDGRNANNNKMLYDKLKKAHNEDNIFFELLNKGQICKNHYENNEINYNALDQTFSRPEYCESCPLFDLKWKGNERNSFSVASCKKIKLIPNIKTHNKEEATVINILVNDNKKKHISPDLKDDYKDCQVLKNLRKQEWNCKYMCNLDVCELKNFENDIDDEKFMSIEVFIKRWLVYFLTDYSKLKEQLNECMNNENNTCIRDCKNFCKCAEQWITKKKNEWQQIKERYLKQYKSENEDVSYHLKSYLLQNPFTKYVKNALNKNETLEQLQESDGCHNSGKYYKTPCEKKDVITIFIDRLTEKIELYNKQPHEETQENCVPLLSNNPYEPEPHPDDENELEDPFSSTSISSRPDFCPDIQPEPEAPQEPAVPAGGKDDTFNGTQEEEEAAKPGQNDTSNQGPEEEIPAPPDGEEVPKEVVPDKEVPVPPQKKTESKKKRPPLKPPTNEYKLTDVLLPTAFPLSVGIAFASLTYLLLKKKTKSTIDLLRIIDIPKGDYDMPTMKSSNRYIPYASHRYKGKTYIYMEGDSDSGHYYEDTTDITSSESEYEELDINDIYVPGSPKYKTLIEVVLEPSKRDISSDKQSDIPPHTQSDMPNGNASINKFTDNEWNKLKQNFISQYLQNIQKDLPNENIIHDNMYKDTQLDDHILYDSMEEKPFITSIHDRDLHNGEEYNYNINFHVPENMSDSTNSMDDPISGENDSYSGIDLINDSLNSDQYVNIYDELLKRKENELFGTNHTKHTTGSKRVAAQTHTDPIINQLNMFHKWLDRHRNMCEQWNQNKKEELLDKLNEEWNKENKNNSNVTDTNGENNITRVLNSDVSIQIDMNSKPI